MKLERQREREKDVVSGSREEMELHEIVDGHSTSVPYQRKRGSLFSPYRIGTPLDDPFPLKISYGYWFAAYARAYKSCITSCSLFKRILLLV